MSQEDDNYTWLLTAFAILAIFGFCVAGEAMLNFWGM